MAAPKKMRRKKKKITARMAPGGVCWLHSGGDEPRQPPPLVDAGSADGSAGCHHGCVAPAGADPYSERGQQAHDEREAESAPEERLKALVGHLRRLVGRPGDRLVRRFGSRPGVGLSGRLGVGFVHASRSPSPLRLSFWSAGPEAAP